VDRTWRAAKIGVASTPTVASSAAATSFFSRSIYWPSTQLALAITGGEPHHAAHHRGLLAAAEEYGVPAVLEGKWDKQTPAERVNRIAGCGAVYQNSAEPNYGHWASSVKVVEQQAEL
jgi:hypothetical protein